MPLNDRAIEKILDEAQESLGSIKSGLEDVSRRLDLQDRYIQQVLSTKTELSEELNALEMQDRLSHMPLRGTVELLSFGRLTIGPIHNGRH